ncbi:metal ABC transporter solute-binding protein, Zn/Mn family [Arhodomonas sp. AD133]|uniref:metal ABC transporter solute-binding protein, Zn/Mn family n=1 Tax=Arhodomonas sp. AD133 TaxID=3415009 RepID=UPI003EB6DE12
MVSSRLRRWVTGVIAACLVGPGVAHAEPVTVYTSIVPVKTFVERVGGDRVAVTSLVKQGQSPATFDPSPRELAALGDAELFVRVGVPFEQAWMTRLRAASPSLTVVDLRERIKLRPIGGHKHAGEAGDDSTQASDTEKVVEAMPEGRVPSEVADPHIWTSPRNAVAMVESIRDALARTDPDGRAGYERNAAEYIDRLRALDRELGERLAPYKGRRFVVFHPSWGYFADAYGLEQVAIESGGNEPGAASLDELIREAREADVSAVFVQDQFSQRHAHAVADAIDAQVIAMDPLAADYIDNLERAGDALAEALR